MVKQVVGLLLKVGGESGVAVSLLVKADGQPCAVLVERVRRGAPSTRDRYERFVVGAGELRMGAIRRLAQPGAVTGPDGGEEPLSSPVWQAKPGL